MASSAPNRKLAPSDETSLSSDETIAQLRAQLQQARDEIARLRDQNDHANHLLAQARRAAEVANETKERFLSAVSHELRTPLSAMVLWTSLIEDQKVVEPEQLREALTAIKHSAEEQQALIENLLDTSRLVAGKIRIERKEVPIGSIVHGSIADSREAARLKNISIVERVDPSVGTFSVDRRRLQQALTQLVNNAVKFTHQDGRVTIELKRVDTGLEISVTDSGIGIAPEFLERIFDRFAQLEHRRVRTEGGLGLGLAIVKQIVEMHGGTVVARSEGHGHGATFVIHLPPAKADAKPGAHRKEVENSRIAGLLDGRHVLLVEDAPTTRRALSAVLHEAGAEIDAVDSASAALEAYARHRPDLIVSDLGLPAVDGCTLIRQIRDVEAAARETATPAIAITAFVGDEIHRKALESGFQNCLTKPVEPVHLVSALSSLAAS